MTLSGFETARDDLKEQAGEPWGYLASIRMVTTGF
jgi:hypothetical protein